MTIPAGAASSLRSLAIVRPSPLARLWSVLREGMVFPFSILERRLSEQPDTAARSDNRMPLTVLAYRSFCPSAASSSCDAASPLRRASADADLFKLTSGSTAARLHSNVPKCWLHGMKVISPANDE